MRLYPQVRLLAASILVMAGIASSIMLSCLVSNRAWQGKGSMYLMHRPKHRQWDPLLAGVIALSLIAQPALSQTPSPTEPSGIPGAIVFVGNIGVSLRDRPSMVPTGCRPDDVVQFLSAFIDAFNRGDQQRLQHFFPGEASQVQDGAFHWYAVGGPPGGINPGFTAENRDELMAYFAERHAHGEYMQLLQIDYGTDRNWEDGERGIDFTLDVRRSAEDIPMHEAGVKGAIDCREQTIYVWSMGDRGIVPDGWFDPPMATPAR